MSHELDPIRFNKPVRKDETVYPWPMHSGGSLTSCASTMLHQAHMHYPQSNGFVERNVQTVEQTLKKVGPRSDIQMALLVLRATPIDSHLPSPAELLYGRRVVSNLPVATWNASGERCEIRGRLDQRQATAKERHDARGVTDLAELYRGQHVRTRNPITHRWEPGRIAEKCSQPRSYRVESPSGKVLQKNRRDIRETVEKHVFLNPDDEPQ